MSSPQPAAIIPNNSTPSRSDVDDILRKKRKIREHKACYPCRTRKVRCDSNVPCKTCIDRNHADLCTFNPPNKRRDSVSSQGHEPLGGLSVAIKKEDWERVCAKLNDVDRFMRELKYDLSKINGSAGFSAEDGSAMAVSSTPPAKEDQPSGPQYVKAMEINEQSHLTGESIHLGGGSVPALVAALRNDTSTRPSVQEVLGKGMLPLFGLDNESATYPFVSLFGQQSAASRINELRKVIPDDADCLERFKDGAHVTYPCIPDITQFEADLKSFLATRNASSPSDLQNPATEIMDGMSLRWVALLFAALASGVQFSTMAKSDRELLSQVYVCCSFECLRMVNYLSNVSVEVIQTMLLLGNVLTNAMNAGAAWSFLGMTIRLAQSLGLHTACEREPKTTKDVIRCRTWWAVLWQDSFLSLSYDRMSSPAALDCPFTPMPVERPGSRSFASSMERICKVSLDTVRNRVAPQSIQSRLSRCVDLRADITRAQSEAAPHLRDPNCCRTMLERCEYWTLYLHASYMLSELCRPAISPSIAKFDRDNELRRKCIAYLMNVVEAFLGLVSVSTVHARCWSVVHRALSAALLLGIVGEPLRNTHAQALLARLIRIMREAAALTDAGELSAPVARSLTALHKLSAQESCTPRQLEEPDRNGAQATTSTPQSGVKFEPSTPATGMYTNGSNSNSNYMSNSTAATPLTGMLGNTNSGTPSQGGLDAAGFSSIPAFDDSAFFLPSPLDGFEDESSPYALMDSIIWGGPVTGR